MSSISIRALLVVAAVFDGILAGATFDRGLIGYAAWRELGTAAWIAYSQHADLTIRGALFYPTLAIGGAFCSFAAAVLFRAGGAARSAALPIYAGAVLAICGLLLTLKAAPFMLAVATAGEDPQAAQRAFDGFYFWSAFRGAAQALAFPMHLWALVALRR